MEGRESCRVVVDVVGRHAWLLPVTLVGVVVLGPFLGAWLLPRRRLAVAAALLSLVPVAVLTLTPVTRQLYGRCLVEWVLPTPARVEAYANLVLFVPPVLLVGVALRRPVLALVLGSLLSAGIETVQALLPVLGRSCDASDWLSNSLGAAVGAGLAGAATGVDRLRRHRSAGPLT